MKTFLHKISIVTVSLLGIMAATSTARAQGFYLNADLGVALAEDVKMTRFITPTPGLKLELDAGPRLSVAGGYNFNDYVGVQLETGFIYNEVGGLSAGGDIDASLSHVPLLVDFVVRYDKPDSKFVPFAGIGFGGDISVLAVDNVRAPNGTRVDGAGSDVVFAWQVFVGARYNLTERISVGGAYKFFSAQGATWDVERSSGDIKSDTANVHSLVADFTIRF